MRLMILKMLERVLYILFDGSKAYTELRKKIVEQHDIETLVPLPSMTFAPNTNVKSDILLIKNQKKLIKNIYGISMFGMKALH